MANGGRLLLSEGQVRIMQRCLGAMAMANGGRLLLSEGQVRIMVPIRERWQWQASAAPVALVVSSA